jgi:DnaK suppressor protein
MNDLTDEQLAQLRAVLEQRRDELESTPLIPADGIRALAVQDVETSPVDQATAQLLNDLALEAAGHHAARLASVRHALAKFDEGQYGECEECGNPIGFSRLQARPEATLCIACQTAREKRPG